MASFFSSILADETRNYPILKNGPEIQTNKNVSILSNDKLKLKYVGIFHTALSF